jgi:hypothetical protein
LHRHGAARRTHERNLERDRRLGAPTLDARGGIFLKPRRRDERKAITGRDFPIGRAFRELPVVAIAGDIGPDLLAALRRDPGAGQRGGRRERGEKA